MPHCGRSTPVPTSEITDFDSFLAPRPKRAPISRIAKNIVRHGCCPQTTGSFDCVRLPPPLAQDYRFVDTNRLPTIS
jgi:hypothetical protein